MLKTIATTDVLRKLEMVSAIVSDITSSDTIIFREFLDDALVASVIGTLLLDNHFTLKVVS